jgi:hypothetical protein
MLTMPQFWTIGGGFGAPGDAICVGAPFPNDGIAEHPAIAMAPVAARDRQRLFLIFHVITLIPSRFVSPVLVSFFERFETARLELLDRKLPAASAIGSMLAAAEAGPHRGGLQRFSKRETTDDLWEENERIGSAGGKRPGF